MGKILLCIDFTHLNKSIKRELYWLPVDGGCSRCDPPGPAGGGPGSRDTVKGYHHIPIAKSSRDLTTFLHPLGRFHYKRGLFGLSNISEHFHRGMDEALNGLAWHVHLVDNVLVLGSNMSKFVQSWKGAGRQVS